MEIKCATCKYGKRRLWEEPCRSCMEAGLNREKWEPTEISEKQRHEIKLEKRPEMLPKPVPIYEHTDSEIPDRVRISFTNGTSAIYDLHRDQPHPVIVENIKIIRKWKQGYVNQPQRRRRNKT